MMNLKSPENTIMTTAGLVVLDLSAAESRKILSYNGSVILRFSQDGTVVTYDQAPPSSGDWIKVEFWQKAGIKRLEGIGCSNRWLYASHGYIAGVPVGHTAYDLDMNPNKKFRPFIIFCLPILAITDLDGRKILDFPPKFRIYNQERTTLGDRDLWTGSWVNPKVTNCLSMVRQLLNKLTPHIAGVNGGDGYSYCGTALLRAPNNDLLLAVGYFALRETRQKNAVRGCIEFYNLSCEVIEHPNFVRTQNFFTETIP